MGRLQEALKGVGRRLVGDEITSLQESISRRDESLELYQEGLAELRQALAMDELGWMRLGADSETEFSPEELRTINQLARAYWMKNPLIKRATYIQSTYVFGQGMTVAARHPEVNAVIQRFMDDPKNKAELTSHQARLQKETELQLFSNIFFAFFVHPSTGHVRVRTIPSSEIMAGDIIYNPDDAKDPWYYKRVRTRKAFSLASGQYEHQQETVYYPDWRYNPEGGHPPAIGGHRVEKVPVYHVAVNKLGDMKFGVSEAYAAFDWAKAYNSFLSDWAKIVRSYARFAWNYVTKGSGKVVRAAAEKLRNVFVGGRGPQGGSTESEAGKVFVGGGGDDGGKLEPIKTQGATTKAEDGRRLLLMVSAATGIFEHYFGDPSTGNLATAKSMERPMELKFLDRQTLWKDVFLAILNFVIDQAAKAPSGPLKGVVEANEYGEEVVILAPDPNEHTADGADDGGPMDRHIDVMFPSILEKDVLARVEAIIKAATLDGKTPAGNIDLKTVTRMLLVALGEDDVDELLEQLFPEGAEPSEEPDDEDDDDEAPAAESKSERLLGAAAAELREAIARIGHAS